jgi:putative transposase
VRVTRSRELVAEGHSPSVVARVAQISRQAIYRVPSKAAAAARRSTPPADEIEAAIVQVAKANQTDGYRMVTALVVRKLGRAVNRKRVLRVMRQRRLIQRRRRFDRRRRPGFFRVTRPNELWHLDMTSVWVAEHGWCSGWASAAAGSRARSGPQAVSGPRASSTGSRSSGPPPSPGTPPTRCPARRPA